jgi:hypothetical protein
VVGLVNKKDRITGVKPLNYWDLNEIGGARRMWEKASKDSSEKVFPKKLKKSTCKSVDQEQDGERGPHWCVVGNQQSR